MNAAQLARKIDNALFLAGYKMRVKWNGKYGHYELNFGHNSDYPHVYAYTSYFTPKTRRYCTVILPTWDYPNGRIVEDTYSCGIRTYVRANIASYTRIAGEQTAANLTDTRDRYEAEMAG